MKSLALVVVCEVGRVVGGEFGEVLFRHRGKNRIVWKAIEGVLGGEEKGDAM